MGLVNVYLDNVSLDYDNFDDDNSEAITNVRPMAWFDIYKQRRAFKKEISKDLMTVEWHPTW